MASGCAWFEENLLKAKGVIYNSKVGGMMRAHPVRAAGGAMVAGGVVGRASGSQGLRGNSSGSTGY